MVINTSFPPLPNHGASHNRQRTDKNDDGNSNSASDRRNGWRKRIVGSMRTRADTNSSVNSNETTERSSTQTTTGGGTDPVVVVDDIDGQNSATSSKVNRTMTKNSSKKQDPGSSLLASQTGAPVIPTPRLRRDDGPFSQVLVPQRMLNLNIPPRSNPRSSSVTSTRSKNASTCRTPTTTTVKTGPESNHTCTDNFKHISTIDNNTSIGDATSNSIWHDCTSHFEELSEREAKAKAALQQEHFIPSHGSTYQGKTMDKIQDNSQPKSTTGGSLRNGSSSSKAALDDVNQSKNRESARQLDTSSSNGEALNATDYIAQNLLTTKIAPSREHDMFVQRLCDDNCGVAVRKINQYGKSNLRYVKCLTEDEAKASATKRLGSRSISSHSGTSWGRSSFHQTQKVSVPGNTTNISYPLPDAPSRNSISNTIRRVLLWGKRKEIQIPIENFVCVRLGKTTERAIKCPAPSSRVLSLITNIPDQLSLDIEAPTKLDRDKFAAAFALFLDVPLEAVGEENAISTEHVTRQFSLPQDASTTTQSQPMSSIPSAFCKNLTYGIPPIQFVSKDTNFNTTNPNSYLTKDYPTNTLQNTASDDCVSHDNEHTTTAILTIPTRQQTLSIGKQGNNVEDDTSHISSLTKNGLDQELVEELHNALRELRAELEESRTEAARAVKVAEQAIQSAERNNSLEWQNTVTHKAAEVAARAQKQSAAAIAKARLAEEKLDGERRVAIFWRKQAEAMEEEAASLQTRAAAAEVQRATAEEQLRLERRLMNVRLDSLRFGFEQTDVDQRNSLDSALSRNRALELEVDSLRSDYVSRTFELPDAGSDTPKVSVKKKRNFGRRKKGGSSESPDGDYKTQLLDNSVNSSSSLIQEPSGASSVKADVAILDKLFHLQAFTQEMKRDFDLMRRATVDDVHQLPKQSTIWASQISCTINASNAELLRLQNQLAMECASRRKLLNEVQDLRETVRVYCRPFGKHVDHLVSVLSRHTLHLNNDVTGDDSRRGRCYEYDRVFAPSVELDEIFLELEDVCLGILDGYNICVMAYGAARSGKTHTMLGEFGLTDTNSTHFCDYGLQLKLMQQLFAISDQRNDRVKDTFTISVVEVFEEKLCDLLLGTVLGETRGEVISVEPTKKRQTKSEDDSSSSKPVKLEIRTDLEGETIVQGLLFVEVATFDEVLLLWEQCIQGRLQRSKEQGMSREQYEATSHVITWVKVSSLNVSTGTSSVGKIQFVDFASANVVDFPLDDNPSKGITTSGRQRDWRFSNKSLETFCEVVEAKAQFERVIPYRNSTLTHLLLDSLEGDTKVVFLACISTGAVNIKDTTATLQFASQLRQFYVGKATRHSIS